ncbi:hypothetical protein [Streptomyces sp. KL116D]|uniref:hypothetical protein n=1 Tax=Streptomyces sp. KL116D TaxID=3045152 RepID=UPI00355913F8
MADPAQFPRELRWLSGSLGHETGGRVRTDRHGRHYDVEGRTVTDTSTTRTTAAAAVPAGDSYLSDTTWVKSST